MTDTDTQKMLYLNVISQNKHQSYNTKEKQESQANTSAKVHEHKNKENAYIKIWREPGCVYN